MKVNLIPTSARAILPAYSTKQSACFDIKACIDRYIKGKSKSNEDMSIEIIDNYIAVIYPGQRALIPTGFIFVIPKGCSMRVHTRSGNAYNSGIVLANGEGIIDSDYPNETFIILNNTSNQPFRVTHGQKIAQGEIVPCKHVVFVPLPKGSEFCNHTDRVGGFGSTGQ